MEKDNVKIAAQRKEAAERLATVEARMAELDAQLRATTPGSPEAAAIAKKLMNLTFTGKED